MVARPMPTTLPETRMHGIRGSAIRPGAFLAQHPGTVVAGLSVAGAVLIGGAAIIISVLDLPSLFLAAPGAVYASLVTLGLAVALRARKRGGTAGIDPEVERRILDVAVEYRGRVTVTAVAHALSMPMAEADAALSSLAKSGHVSVENDPASGVVVFVFPDIDAGLVRRSP